MAEQPGPEGVDQWHKDSQVATNKQCTPGAYTASTPVQHLHQ